MLFMLALWFQVEPRVVISDGTDCLTNRVQPALVLAHVEPINLNAIYRWTATNGQTSSDRSFEILYDGSDEVTATVIATLADGTVLPPADAVVYFTDEKKSHLQPVIHNITTKFDALHPGQTFELGVDFDDPDETAPYKFYWSYFEKGKMVRKQGRSLNLIPKIANENLAVNVIVEDADGLRASKRKILHVQEGNLPPTGRITKKIVNYDFAVFGDPYTLEAQGVDPEGDALTFHWVVIDGLERLEYQGKQLSYLYKNPGKYFSVILTAEDIHGNRDPTPERIIVYVKN